MFVGMGISGGEEGARNGPSLMPGGPKEAYDLLEPIITKCAAHVDGEACTGYLGPIGAGNYVKMVHNGIEYSDMQLISECYDILKVRYILFVVIFSAFGNYNHLFVTKLSFLDCVEKFVALLRTNIIV